MLDSAGVSLRVVTWKQGCVKLSSGVEITGDEIRKFRMRCASSFLSSVMDETYALDNPRRRNIVINRNKCKVAKEQSEARWQMMTYKEKNERQNHMRQIQKLVDHKNKPYVEPWNKGKTKNTDARLATISNDRSGEGNPMFGTRMSDKEKLRKSLLIKERIKTGVWTPCVHNSRTHWNCIYKGTKYRSSWEAVYASLNPNDLYEDVRIEYQYQGTTKIYIVDFVNHITKILVEIKPAIHTKDEKFKCKLQAAHKWCREHDYEFKLLTQQYFIDNFNRIDFTKLIVPNIQQKMARIKYEAHKAN